MYNPEKRRKEYLKSRNKQARTSMFLRLARAEAAGKDYTPQKRVLRRLLSSWERWYYFGAGKKTRLAKTARRGKLAMIAARGSRPSSKAKLPWAKSPAGKAWRRNYDARRSSRNVYAESAAPTTTTHHVRVHHTHKLFVEPSQITVFNKLTGLLRKILVGK
jgi:hypothetical protein